MTSYLNITFNKILIIFNTAIFWHSGNAAFVFKLAKLNPLIAFISNFAVNSMRVFTELYYVDVRNEFALDALRTLTERCGCSLRGYVGLFEIAARM